MSFASTVSMLMAQRAAAAPVILTDEAVEALEVFKRGFIEPDMFDTIVTKRFYAISCKYIINNFF